MITSILSQRTTSAFMLSIGTSLSFESLFVGSQQPYDQERVIPNNVDLTHYDELWINLFTLFRNIIGSVPTAQVNNLLPDDIAYVLAEEVEYIRDIVKTHVGSKVRVVVYSSAYKGLKEKHKHASVRGDTTEKQRRMTDLLNDVINIYYKHHPLHEDGKHYNLGIGDANSINKKVLILSHYAYDLLSYKKFFKMDLLESHTGVLKERAKWYTKYTDGKNLVRIPFNEAFIQVFGDSQTFHPMDKVLRADILELAERSNWNPLTTDERIRFTISGLKNPFFVSILKEML